MRVFMLITVNQDQCQLISASLAQEAQVGFLITTTLDYSSCDEIINLVYHLSQIDKTYCTVSRSAIWISYKNYIRLTVLVLKLLN